MSGGAWSSRLDNVPRPGDLARFLRALARPTRLSALRAVVDGVVVAATLRRSGLRPLLERGARTFGKSDLESTIAVARAVDDGMGILPFAPTCLRRSMTLMRELERQRLTATLRIGVRTVGDRVEAHAWVQAGDRVVNDDAETVATYAELVAGELDTFLPMLR